MSCSTKSREEFARTTPVNPPTVKRKINPRAHRREGERVSLQPYKVPTQLNTFTPVGTAIIIVAVVK